MIDHARWHLAVRNRLRTLVVAAAVGQVGTSGSAFTRSAGSWVAEGFAPGMEIQVGGFPGAGQNGTYLVREVSELQLDVGEVLGATAAGPGRTVMAGVPSVFVLENSEIDDFSPTPGRPWFSEAWLPGGGTAQRTMGSGGEVEALPSYVVAAHVPQKSGGLVARRYADRIIGLFPPGLSIDVGPGDFCWVRWDQGPFPSQLAPSRPGWAVLTVTIPLRIRTPNSI